MGGAASSRYRVPLAIAGVCGVGIVSFTLLQRHGWPHRRDPCAEKCTAAGHEKGVAIVEPDPPSEAEIDPVTPERRAWAAELVSASDQGDLDKVTQMLAELEPVEGMCLLDIDSSVPLCHLPNVTAVYIAAMRGHADILEALLSAGADPNIKCKKATQWDGAFTLTENDTALVVSAREAQKASVEILLRYNADPNTKCDSEYFEGAVEWGEDDDGTEYFYYSALDLAKDAAIKKLLEQSGAVSVMKLQRTPQKVRPRVSQGSRMGA